MACWRFSKSVEYYAYVHRIRTRCQQDYRYSFVFTCYCLVIIWLCGRSFGAKIANSTVNILRWTRVVYYACQHDSVCTCNDMCLSYENKQKKKITKKCSNAFDLFYTGPVSSYLSSIYSYRTVTMVGGTLASLGLMLCYFADSITFLYFRQVHSRDDHTPRLWSALGGICKDCHAVRLGSL